jgi:hypothetical protein
VSDGGGLIVNVRLSTDPGEPREGGLGPTRYALALRRQATNRARKRNGKPTVPEIRAGDCSRCEGWGVVGVKRDRCPVCGGSGGA